MAKAKRSVKSRSKGRGRPRRAAEPLAVRASVTRTEVTIGSAGPPVAGAMPVAFAAESFTVTSVAAADLTAPAVADATELFDVVCSFDSVLASSLDFGVAQSTARKHNKANPGHDAQPIRQQQ